MTTAGCAVPWRARRTARGRRSRCSSSRSSAGTMLSAPRRPHGRRPWRASPRPRSDATPNWPFCSRAAALASAQHPAGRAGRLGGPRCQHPAGPASLARRAGLRRLGVPGPARRRAARRPPTRARATSCSPTSPTAESCGSVHVGPTTSDMILAGGGRELLVASGRQIVSRRPPHRAHHACCSPHPSKSNRWRDHRAVSSRSPTAKRSLSSTCAAARVHVVVHADGSVNGVNGIMSASPSTLLVASTGQSRGRANCFPGSRRSTSTPVSAGRCRSSLRRASPRSSTCASQRTSGPGS